MKNIPSEFDSIRPFEPEELPEVYERLLANEQFKAALCFIFPDVPFEQLAMKMKTCKTNLEFQKAFSYQFIQFILKRASKGATIDADCLNPKQRFTFISNHRDIVLDSGILDVLLIDANFDTTCEIAIGDNLLSLPWVKDLVRINKSFIVERGLPMRQTLLASKKLSSYMHFAMKVKRENIWIAQREGRAKDSNDRTQEALLKMMTMEGDGSHVERLKQLNLVPTAISYEYDPCDYLKAKEFQLKRDNPDYKKTAQDDIENMQTGIMGYKGRIHYACSEPINAFLDSLDNNLPKTEFYTVVAQYIDRCIHSTYRLYPNNYVALDLLEGSRAYTDHYSKEDEVAFEQYLAQQLAKIELPNKDEKYLRERLLTMYAYPAKNFLATK